MTRPAHARRTGGTTDPAPTPTPAPATVRTDDSAQTAGDPAKLRIMRAAEVLFAQRGIDSVSLREIAAASGNGNNNAVQYHFGGKAELVQAIFRWRVSEMEPVRAAWLDAARADGTIDHLATLVRVMCLPIVALTDERGDHSYAAFMIEYHLRHRPLGMLHAGDHISSINVAVREMVERLYGHIDSALPAADQVRHDYRIVLSQLVFLNMLVMSDREELHRRDPDAFARRIDETLAMAARTLSGG